MLYVVGICCFWLNVDAQLPQGLRGGGAFISPLKSNFLVGDPQGDSYRCYFSACSAWRSTWSSVGLLFVNDFTKAGDIIKVVG